MYVHYYSDCFLVVLSSEDRSYSFLYKEQQLNIQPASFCWPADCGVCDVVCCGTLTEREIDYRTLNSVRLPPLKLP